MNFNAWRFDLSIIISFIKIISILAYTDWYKSTRKSERSNAAKSKSDENTTNEYASDILVLQLGSYPQEAILQRLMLSIWNSLLTIV